MRDDELQRALDDYARAHEPTGAEVARVLREVRRGRQRPRLSSSLFAYGGWVVAVAALLVVVAQGRAPGPAIGSDPARAVAREPAREVVTAAPAAAPADEPTAAPPAPAPVVVAPPVVHRAAPVRARAVAVARASAAPAAASAAPVAAPAAVEPVARLPLGQTQTLARGHVHRIESVLEVVREVGLGSQRATEAQCLAEQHRRLLVILESARAELGRLDHDGAAGDLLAVDLDLERLVAQRQAADAVYRDVRRCLGGG